MGSFILFLIAVLISAVIIFSAPKDSLSDKLDSYCLNNSNKLYIQLKEIKQERFSSKRVVFNYDVMINKFITYDTLQVIINSDTPFYFLTEQDLTSMKRQSLKIATQDLENLIIERKLKQKHEKIIKKMLD